MNTLIATDLMTVRQVALLFHLGERSVLSRIKDGRLPAHKMEGGKQWLIRREDALAALQGRPTPYDAAPPTDHPGVVRAGDDPMHAEPGAGIIRRTHTPEGRAHAIAMLHRLREGDIEEQTEAWEFLKTALDKDRLSSRTLFAEQGTEEQGETA